MVRDSQKKARNKWDAENMKIVACKIRRETAEDFAKKAKENGTNPNDLIKDFILNYLDQKQ